jgi:hypothetical protein
VQIPLTKGIATTARQSPNFVQRDKQADDDRYPFHSPIGAGGHDDEQGRCGDACGPISAPTVALSDTRSKACCPAHPYDPPLLANRHSIHRRHQHHYFAYLHRIICGVLIGAHVAPIFSLDDVRVPAGTS